MLETSVREEDNGRRVVKVVGDVDLATADRLVASVTRLLTEYEPVDILVDLSDVEFIDSSGIRALMLAHRATAEHGGSLSVSGARGLVARVLRLTAVDEVLGAKG